jgi:hypothetical protein
VPANIDTSKENNESHSAPPRLASALRRLRFTWQRLGFATKRCLFNILNSDAILTYNQTFTPGGAWLAPQSVLTPRFVKVSSQIDF